MTDLKTLMLNRKYIDFHGRSKKVGKAPFGKHISTSPASMKDTWTIVILGCFPGKPLAGKKHHFRTLQFTVLVKFDERASGERLARTPLHSPYVNVQDFTTSCQTQKIKGFGSLLHTCCRTKPWWFFNGFNCMPVAIQIHGYINLSLLTYVNDKSGWCKLWCCHVFMHINRIMHPLMG